MDTGQDSPLHQQLNLPMPTAQLSLFFLIFKKESKSLRNCHNPERTTAMATSVFTGVSLHHLPAKSLTSPPPSPKVASHLSSTKAKNPNLCPKHPFDLHYGYPKGSIRTTVFSSSAAGDLRPDIDENPEGILSGEWPDNFSLLSYDDLKAYLETQITGDRTKPSALLGEVMSAPIRTVKVDQTLEEINHHFEIVSGLPVIDGELRCIGVISKKDKAKASKGLKSKIGEVMSSPAITLSSDKTVLDAAALMLKEKVHRVPILNEKQQVVGIVTRTDVFQVLEAAEV